MSEVLRHQVAASLRSKRAVFIAGAGVTLSAIDDPTASWAGLIENGARRALDLNPALGVAWLDTILEALESDDLTNWLEAAEQITEALSRERGNQYGRWLSETVGSYAKHVEDPGLPELLGDFGVTIATTNYDDVLARTTGRDQVSARSLALFQDELNDPGKRILHLHGHWADPGTVTFGYTSYSSIARQQDFQAILRAVASVQQLIFVGFGNGIRDPNFTSLMDYLSTSLPQNVNQPIVLSLSHNAAQLRTLGRQRGFSVIDVGPKSADLSIYLSDLLGEIKPHASLDDAPIVYEWPGLMSKLNRLARRIERAVAPDVVVCMSGPGNFAAAYCLAHFSHDPPLLSAVTFPKKPVVSEAALQFQAHARKGAWIELETNRWLIFVPAVLEEYPPGTKVLILDDRVIGGNSQRLLFERLQPLGHEVTRAAIVAHPDRVDTREVDFVEERTARDFTFPWGGKYGRNEPPV
jgi:hypoxanthine phosphoribosyltransferase